MSDGCSDCFECFYVSYKFSADAMEENAQVSQVNCCITHSASLTCPSDWTVPTTDEHGSHAKHMTDLLTLSSHLVSLGSFPQLIGNA